MPGIASAAARPRVARLAALVCLSLPHLAAAQAVTIGPGVDVGASVGISEPLIAQGQTFTVPAFYTTLHSFSVATRLLSATPYAPVFEVYAWNGTAPVGAPLVSATLATVPSNADRQVETFTGAVPLVGGATYLASVSQGLFLGLFRGADAYAGGTFAIGNPHFWTTQPTLDAAFAATFVAATTVPEPPASVPIALGLMAIAVGARRVGRARRDAAVHSPDDLPGDTR